jgi:hypothetical protein
MQSQRHKDCFLLQRWLRFACQNQRSDNLGSTWAGKDRWSVYGSLSRSKVHFANSMQRQRRRSSDIVRIRQPRLGDLPTDSSCRVLDFGEVDEFWKGVLATDIDIERPSWIFLKHLIILALPFIVPPGLRRQSRYVLREHERAHGAKTHSYATSEHRICSECALNHIRYIALLTSQAEANQIPGSFEQVRRVDEFSTPKVASNATIKRCSPLLQNRIPNRNNLSSEWRRSYLDDQAAHIICFY